MKYKIATVLFYFGFFSSNVLCMKTRPRSSSLSARVLRRSSSGSLRKVKKRRLSKGLFKESPVVSKVRKALANNQLTHEDIGAIEFFIKIHKRKQKKRESKGVKKEKRLSLDLNDIKDIEQKDITGRTLLYKTIEQANAEIKEMGHLSAKIKSKLCLLLSSFNADQDTKCTIGNQKPRSPRQIASPTVKKILTCWKKEGWSEDKKEILDKGVQYYDH